MNPQDDESLFLAYGKGDVTAFTTLYARYNPSLYRYFLRQTDAKVSAEDLYQDVWQKVIRGAANYQPTAKFSTWLFTIAHNTLVDHYRQQGRANEVMDDKQNSLADDSESHAEQPVDALNIARIKGSLLFCLNKLPLHQRETFILKEEAGLSSKEVAHIVGGGVEAIKSRLRYAFKNLRTCLSHKLDR